MLVKQSIEIDAPAAKVWQVISGQFSQLAIWVLGEKSSEKFDSDTGGNIKAKDGSTARKVTLNDGTVLTETLEEYSDESMTYKYKVEGFPSFLTLAHNQWKVEKVSDNLSKFTVTMTGTFNIFPGFVMEPLFKYLLCPKLAKGMCVSTKYYVEKGEPSPEKVKEMEKASTK